MPSQPTDFLKEGPLPAPKNEMRVEAPPLGGWEVERQKTPKLWKKIKQKCTSEQDLLFSEMQNDYETGWQKLKKTGGQR